MPDITTSNSYNNRADALRKPPSAARLLELADTGKFHDAAAQMARHADHRWTRLETLCRMLARSFESEFPSLEGWRRYLSDLSAANGAQVLFSSVVDAVQPFDWRKADVDIDTDGDGHIRLDATSVAIWTIGAGNAQVTTRKPLAIGSHSAVHLLSNFTSNTNDSLYLNLKDDTATAIRVRFGANRITILIDGIEPMIVTTDTRSMKLYTIALEPDRVSFLINGVARANVALPSPCVFKRVSLELRGDPTCDLGGFPTALEVWSGDEPMDDLLQPAEALAGLVIEDTIENGTASSLYSLLRNMQQIDLRQHQGRLLQLLDELLQRRCYVPWIFDCFLSCVSEAARQQWTAQHRGRMPKPVVAVEKLRIQFSRNPHRALSLSRLIWRQRQGSFNVLDEVEFSLFEGDILGIIGENGAGKSTLLRTLAGLVPISTGRIQVFGRHMLLSAGMGMRPEMTGRENIYLGGCFMGLTPREMDAMVDEIVTFAELEEAIDRPFKYYSDGMKSRLVFSLATSVSPDILMLDELLSAGDLKFQKKAAQRMHELLNRANLVIVVTHGLHFVREHCNKALYLSHGKQRYFGEPDEAISHYLSDLHLNNVENDAENQATALNQVIINQLNAAQQFVPDVSA